MASIINWPAAEITAQEELIRDALSRAFTIRVKTSGSNCPICSLDPVTNLSTDPFCPVCSGYYYIGTITSVTRYGHVRWISQDQPRFLSGGTLPEGDCYITITRTDENIDYIRRSLDFVVDDRNLTLKNYQLRGQPTPNRIRIVLVEELTK